MSRNIVFVELIASMNAGQFPKEQSKFVAKNRKRIGKEYSPQIRKMLDSQNSQEAHKTKLFVVSIQHMQRDAMTLERYLPAQE